MIVVTRPCMGPGCSKQVTQTPGRRQKDTCSPACRQRLCQQRKHDREWSACRRLWLDWPAPLGASLEAILDQTGPVLAAQVAQAIHQTCCPGGPELGMGNGWVTVSPRP